jgi:hypothetical protein
MKMYRKALIAILLVIVGTANACTSAAQKHGRPPPSPDSVRPTFQVPETMLEDRNALTLNRLGILNTYIGRFSTGRGGLPGNFAELRSVSPDGFDIASVDGWGNVIRYEVNESRYTLRSAGADSQFGTGDDLMLGGVAGRSRPCYIISGDGRRFDFGGDDPLCSSS